MTRTEPLRMLSKLSDAQIAKPIREMLDHFQRVTQIQLEHDTFVKAIWEARERHGRDSDEFRQAVACAKVNMADVVWSAEASFIEKWKIGNNDWIYSTAFACKVADLIGVKL